MNAESSAARSEMEESFTVPELPGRNCKEDWCGEDVIN